ncbi:MAG: c-type cytochrome, partial [Bdellovibrionales bacterium]
LFLIVVVIATVGCDPVHIVGPISDNSRFSLPKEQKAKLSYAYVNQRVFLPKCISCHGNSGGVALESFNQVQSRIRAINTAVFEKKTMPKNDSLSQEQLAILWSWIDIGAPETQTDSEPVETTPLEAKFESIDKNIFQIRCITCHSPTGTGKRILLGRSDLLNSPLDLVLPGNPDESGLVIAIERADDKRMPPAKGGYSELKIDEKLAIREWIKNGASD